MFDHKQFIVCDVVGCNNTTSPLITLNGDWQWFQGKYDVCPVCAKKVDEKLVLLDFKTVY